MVEDLLTQLEHILEREYCVVTDTSTLLLNNQANEPPLIRETQNASTLSDLPETLVDYAVLHFQRLQPLLIHKNIFATKEVFREFERQTKEISKSLQIIKESDRRTDSGEYSLHKRKHDSQRMHKLEIATDLQTTLTEACAALRKRKISFENHHPTYKILFEFFKYLIPYTKPASKQNFGRQGVEYLFGDESIAAATFYFTLTGEHTRTTTRDPNKRTLTIVSQDHDIKRALRLGYNLFATIGGNCFKEAVSRNPFKMYVTTGKERSSYQPFIDTQNVETMNSPQLTDKTRNELLRVTEFVFDRVI